jgi:trk system potassium uptake protein TrkA
MKLIIIGCGRMGSGLTLALQARGHSITVIDNEVTAFERLGTAFKGTTIVGVGFDRDTLLQAGIERTDGLAALTTSDEANVVIARVASQMFHVPRVVARVYDPRKAEIYHRLGLQTINPVTWGIQRIAELLCYTTLDTLLSLGDGKVELVELELPSLLAGRTVNDVTISNEAHVVAISRDGQAFLPTLGTVFKRGDLVHLAVLATSMERLKRLLGV